MIIALLKQWVPIDNIEHTSTTWLLSSDKECKEVIALIENSDKLNLIMFDVDVPLNTDVYVKATRHFNNGGADYSLDPVSVINTDKQSAMILQEELFVDVPMVYVSKEDILSDAEKITIRTSKFRGNDGHMLTHWIVTDGCGRILFSKLYDSTNLDSIEIDNLASFKEKSRLVFMAIHVTSCGIESKVGSSIVEFSNFNFEVTSLLSEVSPLIDYKLTFGKINSDLPINLAKVAVYDLYTEENYIEQDMSETNLTLTIPWYLLSKNSVLGIKAYGYDNAGGYSNIRYKLAVQTNQLILPIDSEYVYKKNVDLVSYVNPVKIPTYVSPTLTQEGDMLTPVYGSKLIHKLKFNETTKKYVDAGEVKSLSLLNKDNTNTYLQYLENRLLLVDTVTYDGIPIFLVYKHNVSTDTYTLVNSLPRDDETISIGRTNAIVQVSPTEFIYNPQGLNKLRKYDIIENKLVDLKDIPVEGMTSSVVIKIAGDRLLVIGGPGFTNFVYDIQDNSFSAGNSTMPASFIGRELKSIRLINGDYLIYKTSYQEGDTDNSILYFNFNTSKFELLPIVFDTDKVPNTALLLTSGRILFYKYTFKNDWEDKNGEIVELLFQ